MQFFFFTFDNDSFLKAQKDINCFQIKMEDWVTPGKIFPVFIG